MTIPTTPADHRRLDYGRQLEDFEVGAGYQHPFEVTVDAAIVGPYMASFIDATPLWSSDRVARHHGLARRPVPPHLLLNLGLSFSVHDTSQQAIAHLAYVRVAFPKALPIGGTVRGATRVLEVKPSGDGKRGVVTVHTVLVDEDGDRVLDLVRRALIRGGQLQARPALPVVPVASADADTLLGRLPVSTFADAVVATGPDRSFVPPLFGHFEDLRPGLTLVHANGRTVSESEHMQLSAICRNSHPLHWDAIYSQASSFTGERVVYGGLVLAWTLTQASVDVGGHVLWEAEWSDGAHPAPVQAGDTLFACSRVLAARALSDSVGEVILRHVGVKNVRPEALLAAGADLFTAEREKPTQVAEGELDRRVPEKVVEITRRVLVRRRSPA